MFYSQTFLARKGPLGTVWCAAHLQGRLRKSHYTSTDIESVVERITHPDVPIALRLSAYLLLGVARIYAKKVDYLAEDCNTMVICLNKAFTAVQVNLAENDRTATFESVTLPQTFNLDDLEMEDYMDLDGSPDIHLRSREEITLEDQIPTGMDPFVAITFDEDFPVDTSPVERDTDMGTIPVLDDSIPPSTSVNDDGNYDRAGPSNQTEGFTETQEQFHDAGPSNQTEGFTETQEQFHDTDPSNQTEGFTETREQFHDTGPSNQTEGFTETQEQFHDTDVLTEIVDSGESNQTTNPGSRDTDNNSPPEYEIMRDAVHVSSPVRPPHLSPNEQNDATDQRMRLEQDLLEKEILSPIPEVPFPSGERSFQLRPHSEPHTSAASGGDPQIFHENSPPGDTTPGLGLVAPTPPRRRNRKRKNFDRSPVLKNKFVKRGLDNCTDLLRIKRKAPSSALDVWKQNMKLRKESVFHEPLLTGLSPDLSSFFAEGHNFVNRHTIPREEDAAEPSDRTSPVIDVNPEPTNPTSPPATEVISPGHVTSPAPAASTVLEPVVGTSSVPVDMDTVLEPVVGTSSVPADMDTVLEPPVGNSSVPEDMDTDMDIEFMRDDGSHHTVLPELPHSPIQTMPSTLPRGDDSTPSPQHFQSTEMNPAGNTTGSEMFHTVDIATSAGTYSSGFKTPTTNDDLLVAEDTQLSHILELIDSPEMEDCYSPEADNTPAGSSRQRSKGTHQLSGRTRKFKSYLDSVIRAVAEYLERQSPSTPTLEEPCKEISLNKILEGKTRKLCARMFYETLVLKSYGVVEVERKDPQEHIRLKFDVEQTEPYGDILLKLSRLGK
ncbi:Sister chromatid cohesion 1 protein 3 [Linum perenne]